MAEERHEPVWTQIANERSQGPETRTGILTELEKLFGRPVVSFFTSFSYEVSIEDADADMIEGVLQKLDLSDGLALIINSPGGYGLAAERIVNVCRSYSGTGEYWAVVPNKAKSAATMVCFGASKIYMGTTSELGPIDPQVSLIEGGALKRFSAHNVVESYDDLFQRAIQDPGNLHPYLQQLERYDERDIREHQAQIELSKDIAARTLARGMMEGITEEEIKQKVRLFLSPPEGTDVHGRPIYRDEAASCGLIVDSIDIKSRLWELIYELYLRTNNYVETYVAKSVETKNHAFYSSPPSGY